MSQLIKNPYGYFDETTREFIITHPNTPTPWINYIGEGKYGGIVSNTGGGFSFDQDPRNRRVTRYHYNGIPADQPGRYIYLRDQADGDFWSATWQPTPSQQLDSYECRHGAGYTRITTSRRGVQATILYFIPPGQAATCPLEIWVLTIKNLGSQPRTLRTFTYAEFCYWDTHNDLHNLDWAQHILHTRQSESILYTCTQFRPTTTFFASNMPIIGFDSDREAFLGPWRDLSNPQVVETGTPGNTQAARGNNIGSLCHEVTLQPGQEQEIIYYLGVTEDASLVPSAIQPYRTSVRVKQAFYTLQANWEEYFSSLSIQTPDPEMNAMLNTWNQIQCRTTLYWSRFVSGYETGLGRGMGTRDSAQDILGVVHSVPQHARTNLTVLWRLQFQDGHTWHQVFPLTGEGGPGLASEFPQWPQWFCDDHLWLIIATCAYLRETANFAFLDEKIPYYDQGEDTVWNHILRAIQFTLSNRGPHGLPRLGFSDWDDTMNLDHGSGKAESVWCAMQFCRALLDFADLCEAIGKIGTARHFREMKKDMERVITSTAWDGNWYARAYDNEGIPIGVQAETEHKINLIPQTWAVLAEIDTRARQEQAMQSAHEHLNTPLGLALMTPPYTRGSERVRGTTTFPPGAKENGGIFCHANTWAIIAAAQLGWAERAYQYYRQVMPLARQDSDLFAVEPYVYCQNICGPSHPQFGHGRNSWLTGTAAWTFVAGTQWILGIRPTFKGLQVAPQIPAAWHGFTATRIFRGVTYSITVERKGTGNTPSLTVDGKPIEGNIIPLPPAATNRVTVHVTLA